MHMYMCTSQLHSPYSCNKVCSGFLYCTDSFLNSFSYCSPLLWMMAYYLLRWLDDETTSIVAESGLKKGSTREVGALVKAKFGYKFYDAEILQVSGM